MGIIALLGLSGICIILFGLWYMYKCDERNERIIIKHAKEPKFNKEKYRKEIYNFLKEKYNDKN